MEVTYRLTTDGWGINLIAADVWDGQKTIHAAVIIHDRDWVPLIETSDPQRIDVIFAVLSDLAIGKVPTLEQLCERSLLE